MAQLVELLETNFLAQLVEQLIARKFFGSAGGAARKSVAQLVEQQENRWLSWWSCKIFKALWLSWWLSSKFFLWLSCGSVGDMSVAQ